MIQRRWDPQGKYKAGFVKEYAHWILEVSFRQHTLGCFIIFVKRNIERISELTDEELIELKKVMKEFELTMQKIDVFKPDRFNYLQLGNNLHHLHFHAIPRYAHSRTLLNKEWIDITFGHPPIMSKSEVDVETVKKIKHLFMQNMQ